MKHQQGYTLVELTIAIAIFGGLLVIVMTTVVHMIRLHQAGIASRATQQAARYALENLVRDARAAESVVISDNNPPMEDPDNPAEGLYDTICLQNGSSRIRYYIDSDDNKRHMHKDTIGINDVCEPPADYQGATVIHGLDVKMADFRLTNMAGDSLRINLTFTSALPGLARCDVNARYCAATNLTSSVKLRGAE